MTLTCHQGEQTGTFQRSLERSSICWLNTPSERDLTVENHGKSIHMTSNSAQRFTRPTIIDVAAAAGVSKSLVSLALSNKPGVSAASRQKIEAAAAKIGYTSNTWARSLVRGRTRLIGVVTTDVSSSYNADVVVGIEDEATAEDYEVLLTHGRRDPAHLTRGVERMLQLGVDGLIVVSSRVPQDVLDAAARRRPVVVVGRPDAAGEHVDVIHNDDELGGALAVKHLYASGHRRIGFIATSTQAAVRARGAAYTTAMRDHGLNYHWLRSAADHRDPDFAQEMITELTDSPDAPSALFVSTDGTAVRLLGAALDHKMRVPQDLALVGYNNSTLAAAVRPALTSVNHPRNAMGKLAMQYLLERLNGRTEQRRAVMRPELVLRASSTV